MYVLDPEKTPTPFIKHQEEEPVADDMGSDEREDSSDQEENEEGS